MLIIRKLQQFTASDSQKVVTANWRLWNSYNNANTCTNRKWQKWVWGLVALYQERLCYVHGCINNLSGGRRDFILTYLTVLCF